MSNRSSVNLELLQKLLEFEPRRADDRPVDLADLPRDDDDGELICGRERLKAGAPCPGARENPVCLLRSP